MTNQLDELFTAIYVGGLIKRPTHGVLTMPSQSGKSLTAARYGHLDDILYLGGDVTAQSTRQKLDKLNTRNILHKLSLVIVEDWSKIRTKMRSDVAALLAQIASGTLSVSQYGIEIEPTRMNASVLILAPDRIGSKVFEKLYDVGVGNRFIPIIMSLSDVRYEELIELGLLNRDKQLLTAVPPTYKQLENTLAENPFNKFYKEFKSNSDRMVDVNLAYSYYISNPSNYPRNYESYKNTICRRNDTITWDGYWEHQVTIDDKGDEL